MGRKLEFSKDKALLQAMESFWARGYDATSMRDLAQRLNLHLGSVYNALGDKEQVFEAAFRLHLQHNIKPALEKMSAAADPREALQNYINRTVDQCHGRDTTPGCFLINSLLIINHINERVSSAVKEYLEMSEAALTACVQRAQNMGQIESKQGALQIARFVLSSCKSMHVMKKMGANDDFINDIHVTLNQRLFKAA